MLLPQPSSSQHLPSGRKNRFFWPDRSQNYTWRGGGGGFVLLSAVILPEMPSGSVREKKNLQKQWKWKSKSQRSQRDPKTWAWGPPATGGLLVQDEGGFTDGGPCSHCKPQILQNAWQRHGTCPCMLGSRAPVAEQVFPLRESWAPTWCWERCPELSLIAPRG